MTTNHLAAQVRGMSPSTRIAYALLFAMAAVVFGVLALFVYWGVINRFTASTTFRNGRIVGSTTLRPNDNITLHYDITRYRSCTLDVSRLIKRVDGGAIYGDQERQVDHVVQNFKADGKPHPSSYSAELPAAVPPGDYIIFSRSRYYCNGLDWIEPRYLVTEPLRFTIIARRPGETDVRPAYPLGVEP